jgi:hypothetical protein
MAVATTAIVFLFTAATAAASTQDPHKICTERYNVEKASGTIPTRMSKATYLNQCIGSIRRQAKLEQQLAQQAAQQTPPTQQQVADTDAGSNEATATPPRAPTISKPAHVKTAPPVAVGSGN